MYRKEIEIFDFFWTGREEENFFFYTFFEIFENFDFLFKNVILFEIFDFFFQNPELNTEIYNI